VSDRCAGPRARRLRESPGLSAYAQRARPHLQTAQFWRRAIPPVHGRRAPPHRAASRLWHAAGALV
jgi:hypothetical protein